MSIKLTVPVSVVALSVGHQDVELAKKFAGATTNFTAQTQGPQGDPDPRKHLYLGKNVVRSLRADTAAPLAPGVHLHWEIPEGLMRGTTTENGQLDFPALPNRWLVHRLRVRKDTSTLIERIPAVDRTSWVIKSDQLFPVGTERPDGVAIPVLIENRRSYRYCGGSMDFDAFTADPDHDNFKKVVGKPLNAASTGEIAFISYYPNCRNIFGFHDPQPIAPNDTDKTQLFLYALTGWYGDTNDDILTILSRKVREIVTAEIAKDKSNPALNDEEKKRVESDASKRYEQRVRQEIKEALSWNFDNTSAFSDMPEYESIYHGAVHGVRWTSESTSSFFYQNDAADVPKVEIDLSLGNSVPEALARIFQKKAHDWASESGKHNLSKEQAHEINSSEFQLELHHYLASGGLDTERGSMNALLWKEARHLNGFQSIESGTIYIVESEHQENPENATSGQDHLHLSPRLAIALTTLNERNTILNIFQACQENETWQLFADWYRLAVSSGALDKNMIELADKKYQALYEGKPGQIDTIAKAIAQLNQEISKLQEKLAGELKEIQYRLKKVPAPRFWQANDLVFSAASSGSQMPNRFGKNYLYIEPDYLKCRLEGNYLRKLTLTFSQKKDGAVWNEHQNTYALEDGEQISFPIPPMLTKASAVPNLTIHDTLLRESLLLDPEWIIRCMYHTYQNIGQWGSGWELTFSDIRKALEESYKTSVPVPPVEVAHGNWTVAMTIDEGTVPSLVSASEWGDTMHGKQYNQWVPVFADWDIEYEPIYPVPSENNLKYPADIISKYFDLLPESYSAQLHYKNVANGNAFRRKSFYSGLTILPNNTIAAINARIEALRIQIQQVIEDIRRAVAELQAQLSSKTPNEGALTEEIKKKESEIAHFTLMDDCLVFFIKYFRENSMIVQSFGNLNDLFLMRRNDLQLRMGFDDYTPAANSVEASFVTLTQKIGEAIGWLPADQPDFDGSYNPLRTGYIQSIALTLIDMFGVKKQCTVRSCLAANTLDVDKKNTPPKLNPAELKAYLPPRLAQPARLFFRLISMNQARNGELSESDDAPVSLESNLHPLSNPICGWLLFNRVNDSLFVHDAQGMCLGYLYLNEQQQQVRWQTAPGKDIADHDVSRALQEQTGVLKDLIEEALYGSNGSRTAFFKDFMAAIDHMNGYIVSSHTATSKNIATVLSRPLALVQAELTLDLHGTPLCYQARQPDMAADLYGESDYDYDKISFPVRLGQKEKAGDGMIGYFIYRKRYQDDDGATSNNSYDWNQFFTMGASSKESSSDSGSGVKRPTSYSLVLKPVPGSDDVRPQNKSLITKLTNRRSRFTKRVLMLLDPLSPFHIETGFLPVKQVKLPPETYQDAMKAFGFTFATGPILSGGETFYLPLPVEVDGQWTWLQPRRAAASTESSPTGDRWLANTDINTTLPEGLWDYTPQQLLDGWLRVQPNLLLFDLVKYIAEADQSRKDNAESAKIPLQQGRNHCLLKISNSQNRDISITAEKSTFRLYLGDLVPADSNLSLQTDPGQAETGKAPILLIRSADWRFKPLQWEAKRGYYVSAVAKASFTLAYEELSWAEIVVLNIINVHPRAMFSVHYAQIGGIDDGIYRFSVDMAPR